MWALLLHKWYCTTSEKKGFVCLIHKRVEYVWKISQALVWINGYLFRAHSYNFLRIYKPIIELLFNNNYAWMRACMLSNFKLFRFFKVRNFSPLPFLVRLFFSLPPDTYRYLSVHISNTQSSPATVCDSCVVIQSIYVHTYKDLGRIPFSPAAKARINPLLAR